MRYVKLHHDRLQAPLIEDVKVCLVLGAKLRPDNSLSPILQLRVRVVSILAKAYPDWLFYISGCRADTSVIYRTLVEEYHIPEERCVLDSCGYNTFRSLWDMDLFFKQTRFYILTSSFHIARSVRIARWLGYDAWGIDISEYERVKTNPYYWREQLAALRSLWLVFCVRTPICDIESWIYRKILLRRVRRNEQQFDAQNEQILQRAMTNVDKSMPLTEYFFRQLMEGGIATSLTQPQEEEHLIVSLSRVDCTTVMEDVLALALCYRDGRTTLADLKDYYRRMHYQNGVITFATRNHYFTWIMQSAIKEGFVERISPDEPAFPFTGVQDMQPSYMTRNKHLFLPQMENKDNYEAIALRQQQGVRFTYIPRELLNMPQNSELGVIRDGDILAVVCDQHSWSRGVEIKHLLIAKWLDGRLHFYHASEDGLGFADMDAYTYMKDKFTMIGVAVYRLKCNDAAE
jgi:hypothetical protein